MARVLNGCNAAVCAVVMVFSVTSAVQGQTVAKYGATFLEGGVGARALGMGGAAVALVRDVTAGYWNVAGLSGMQYPQAAYMHAERFGSIVTFDYASVAFPINNRSTFGVSFFRNGVDDIPNTWAAWDPIRDQPKPRPENFIELFSAVDYAFFTSYARALSPNLYFGFTGKILRRSVGNYQRGWGYGFDVAAQYQRGRFLFGVNLQDASTMLISWSINQEEVQPIQDVFGLDLPEGGSELYLPVARLGTGYILPFGGGTNLTLGMDVDLRFDGQETYVLDAGGISYHPRLGTELSFKDVVALRGGLNNVAFSDALGGWQFTPTVGAGLAISQFNVDYAFGDFAGLTADLGYSHRLSVHITLEQPSLKRVIE